MNNNETLRCLIFFVRYFLLNLICKTNKDMKTKIFFFAAILAIAFSSCENKQEVVDRDPNMGHLDNFLEKSKSTTKELQDSKIDYKRTVKLTFVMERFKKDFPVDYEAISSETNGWEIAKILKRNSNFVSLCKEEGLDIQNVSYIEKDEDVVKSNE
jgi:hypothetical protein